MALKKLDIPPGVVNHGTDTEAANRWRDTNLVRWSNGALRPVGGWQDYNNAAGSQVQLDDGSGTQTIPRGAHSWQTFDLGPYLGAGTYNALYAMDIDGAVMDITPAGLASGRLDAGENLGFGGKAFGEETFGTARTADGELLNPTTWSLDNWGEFLVGCSTGDGRIFEWQLGTGLNAAALSGAPINNRAMMVTAERVVFALGAANNPRKVQWCDREDNTTWTPAVTNEAGDIELQTNGEILAGLKVRGRALLLTTTDAHLAIYNGPPTVYGFERIGTGCGLLAPLGAVSVDAGAFWMGRNGFYLYDGNSVQPLPCEVQDYVFTDINRTEIAKTFAVPLQRHNEVWWFYPSGSSTEPDRYVFFDYLENHWGIGKLARAAGVDYGVFPEPMWFGTDAKLYRHERGSTHPGGDVYAETGPMTEGVGDSITHGLWVIPDEKVQGQVTLTFKTRFHPNDTERSYGPYTMANPTSVRFAGRQIRMRVDGIDGTAWRVGAMRLDAYAGGGR